MLYEKGHEKVEGSGRPKGAVTQCKEIRIKRRENALAYVVEQQARLLALEKAILEDAELDSKDRYRLLLDIEKVRQQEVTLSVPSEQNVRIDEDGEAKSSRRLLLERMEQQKNKESV